MNAVPIHVLVLEDSPADALLLRVALERDPLDQFSLTIVERLGEGLSLLAHSSFDIIVLDLGLPDSQGLKTFESLHQAAPHLPTIVFSGNTDDKDAMQAVRAGAQDYLVKSVASFEMAGRAIRHAIERHKLQKSLQESEARFATIFEHSPVAIGISRDRDQKVLHVNTAFMDLYGLSREEIIGYTTEELKLWTNLEDRRRFIEQLQSQKRVIGFETMTYAKTGARREVLVSGEIMEINGELCRVVQVIDITERKQSEQLIRETNAKLAHAQSRAHIGNWEDYLPTGELSWSDEMYRIMGVPLHTPIRLTEAARVFPPEERRRLQEAIHATLYEGVPYSMDYRIVLSDGTERYIHDEGEVVRDDNGTPLWMRGTTQDITERKLTEETLIKNQQLLHEAQGIAHLGSWTSYIQAGMYDASPECARLLGWEAGLHPIQDLFEAVHPEDQQEMETAWSMALQNGDFDLEHRIIVKGQVRWVHVKAQIRFDLAGRPLFALGITQDITERKEAEDALRASEERYRLITQYVDDIVWQLNPHLQFVFASPAAERVLGYTVAETLTMNVAEILEAEGLRQMQAIIDARLSGEPHAHRPSEYKMKHKDGYWVDVEVVSAPVFDGQKHLLGFVGITRQVTERKQAEMALRASEEKYRTLAEELEDRVQQRTAEVQDLYENAPTGYHSLDGTGKFIRINQTELNWLGYRREEVLGHSFSEFITPESQLTFQKSFPIFLARGWIHDLEFEMVRKDETTFSVLVSATSIRDEQGNHFTSRSTVFDNTNRKQAEEALRTSEARLNFLLSKTPAMIFTAKAEKTLPLTFVSDSVLTILGYEPHIFLEQPGLWVGLVHPDDLANGKPAAIELLETGHTVWEARLRHADGHYRWMSTGMSLLYENGTPHEIIGYSVDIQARKQAEEALRESQASLQNFLDTASDLIQRMDENGRYTYVNRAWCNTLGYTLEEALQMTMFEVIAPKYTLHCQNILENLSNTGAPQDFEIAFNTKDGRTVIVEGGVSIHRDPNGQRVTNGIFRNITLRKQAEDTLRQSRDELKAANLALEQAARLKDEFLANMSHELRTPLNSILAFSEGLIEQYRGPLNAHQLTSVRNIEASGRHLLTLINDILDLSKVEAGHLDLQVQLVSLADICESSLVFVKEAASKKALRLGFHLNDHLALMEADPKRLKQILVNLLSNAVKFTPQNGQVTLEVVTDAEAGQVTFSVKDTGIGIAREDLNRLFHPFTQLDSSLSRQHEGTGLGLALVRRLAEMHGGGVCVQSEIGQGSEFTVALPYHAPLRKPPLPAAEEPPQNLRLPRTALLVDDSESVTEQLSRYLEELGIQTTIHPGGKGALEQAIQLQPGVILLDLMMPDTSGWEVLAQLKAEPRTRAIPVIIISVSEERTHGLAAGAADYLVKPISRKLLQESLHTVAGIPENGKQALVIATQTDTPETIRILLAEDNDFSIQAISDYLEAKGYQMFTAHNGREALEQARALSPHLILMDIQMPEMDGLEAIQRLRALSAFATTPIIALTALAMPGDRERCIQAGANEYMSKPVRLKELAHHIQTLLAQTEGENLIR